MLPDHMNDLAAGLAGEHLVCAELLMAGYRAFLAEQICPYDVAVEYNSKLIRIQVKSTRCPRCIPQRKTHNAAYLWHVRRAGKKGKRVYAENEFDLLALVALDIKRIAYMLPSENKNTVHIRHPDVDYNSTRLRKTFDMFTFESALARIIE